MFNKLNPGPWDFLPMKKTKINSVALKRNSSDIHIFQEDFFLVVNLERSTRQELIHW